MLITQNLFEVLCNCFNEIEPHEFKYLELTVSKKCKVVLL